MKVEIIKSNQKEKWVKEEYKPALFDTCSEIIIDLNKKDQKILGFGGAFTDAAEVTYHSLSKEKQQEYIKAYFSKDGLNYNLGRYPLMSTDFSPEMYEYLSDENLCNFSIIYDKSRINFVKDAIALKPDLWLISAPWSPSRFMKDNNDRCHGGKLLKQYYGLWADTLLTSIKELGKEGIKISALTTQNEPLATQTWESCLYSSEEEADFLMNYLIPKAKENRLDLKFMVFDHNRDKMLERADQMFAFGLKQEEQQIVEVSYLLAPEAQGLGYAHEALEGLLKWAKEYCELKVAIAKIHNDNAPSLKFIERMKFRRDKEQDSFVIYRKNI